MKTEWATYSLGRICEEHGGLIQTGPFGSQLHHHDYVEFGTPVVMPKDIKGGAIDCSGIARINEENVKRLAKHQVALGDVVIPRRGEISKCALISETEVGFLCGTGCLKITPPSSVLNSFYFKYFLGHADTIDWLESNAVGSTMLNLSAGILKKLPVVLPDLISQKKIAAILSAYDDLIENNLQRIKLLEEMAQITYEEWFVRMKFPGHETAQWDKETGLPEGWERLTFFDVMDVLSGGTPKTDNPEYWNGTINFYTPKDAASGIYTQPTEKKITADGLKTCNSKLYPKDTLFITARGTVGKLNLAHEPMAMNQSCYALRAKDGLSQYFLYCSVYKAIDAFKGAANGGVFDAIVVDTFKFLFFVKPNVDVVNDFTVNVAPVFDAVFSLLKQNELLREAREILLPRLMTGVIDVDQVEVPEALLARVA